MISPDKLNEIVSYISNHYKSDITLATLSKQFNIDKYALSRQLNKRLGEPISIHIQKLRLNEAKNLLCSNLKMRTKEIAFECGFKSESQFSRCFKKQNGKRLKDYRNSPAIDIRGQTKFVFFVE